MAETLTASVLQDALAGTAAALRCRRRLQPAGGPGTRVLPPTFAGAVYAVEWRTLPGRDTPVACVVLDTVQSQANRMEDALQAAVDDGRLKMPIVEVDFTPYFDPDDVSSPLRLIQPIGRITSLQVPHRLSDAILRDSEYDGRAFRESSIGKSIDLAALSNATPLYELCPTAALFGMWDSTGPKGGLGAKFERAIVSEIVGIGVPARELDVYAALGKSRGVRRDPLGIRKEARVKRSAPNRWSVIEDGGTTKGALAPSEINHGNVPFESPNVGVTIDYAEQTVVLSLAGQRRLKFPIGNGQPLAASDQQRVDLAARSVLAALGLYASTLAAEQGLDLRSRCLLWPEADAPWELLEKPGAQPRLFSLDSGSGLRLLNDAVDAAGAISNGQLRWPTEPIRLTPSRELLKLVRRSQEAAVVAPEQD